MYQNKSEDQVVTPAHLLLIPLDSGSVANFTNFKAVGLDTLQASSAFGKIRNATKIYNSHLVHTPSNLTQKYFNLNELFVDENDLLATSSFGFKRQHAMNSVSSLGNSHSSTLLDSHSFDQFLSSNLISNSATVSELSLKSVGETPLSIAKDQFAASNEVDAFRVSNIMSQKVLASPAEARLSSHPSVLTHVNDDSDKAGLEYPSTRSASLGMSGGSLQNPELGYTLSSSTDQFASTTNYANLSRSNESSAPREYNLSGPNSKVLLADQSVRAYPEVKPSKSNFNLSASTNTILANSALTGQLNQNNSPLSSAVEASVDYVDSAQFNKLASSRSFISESHPAVLSSDRRLNSALEFDTTQSVRQSSSYSASGTFESTSSVSQGSVGDVFVGSREKTPRSINTAY